MLTLFAIPKAFAGPADEAQRRAVASWTALPGAEVLLFGDDEGVAAAAAELGAVHVPGIERTGLGTPLVSSAFARAHEVASHATLCYVNADIVFLGDLGSAVASVRLPRYLLTGRRINVDPGAVPVDEAGARRAGRMEQPWGADWFVFPKDGSFARLPRFAVGRPAWDNWMIFHARSHGIPVIDATRTITAVHPEHGYDHIPAHADSRWGGPEADANRALRGAVQPAPPVIFHLWDATHVLTRRGPRPTVRPVRLWRSLRTRRSLAR